MTKTIFQLTRRAALDLHNIYDLSVEHWGVNMARSYIDRLYAVMGTLKQDSNRSRQRKERATPFDMILAEKHFIVYEIIDDVPIIITLLHQRRDIESIMRDFTPAFLAEIETYRCVIVSNNKSTMSDKP